MNKPMYDKDTNQAEILASLFVKTFKNQSFFDHYVLYTDQNGRLWKREEKDGYYHFSCELKGEYVEVGYMKAYKGSIEKIHTAFIG